MEVPTVLATHPSVGMAVTAAMEATEAIGDCHPIHIKIIARNKINKTTPKIIFVLVR